MRSNRSWPLHGRSLRQVERNGRKTVGKAGSDLVRRLALPLPPCKLAFLKLLADRDMLGTIPAPSTRIPEAFAFRRDARHGEAMVECGDPFEMGAVFVNVLER